MNASRISPQSLASHQLFSSSLQRQVRLDFYSNAEIHQGANLSLILFNDGQDLVTMRFSDLLKQAQEQHALRPLLCVGIHCGEDRKNEYGLIQATDYLGRGTKAKDYSTFIRKELLATLESRFAGIHFSEKTMAGFSLGGLSAFDLVWNHPELFSRAGVFSGSFWWRSIDQQHPSYNNQLHRLVHLQIRKDGFREGLKFFFQCGELDESADRNQNGVIDSIDDTLDIMRELLAKGYLEGKDFRYLQLLDGRHDVATWARSLPHFLHWGWSA
ncbi:MAG: alpha/beta hydrolase [Chitinophagaceae bacterium]